MTNTRSEVAELVNRCTQLGHALAQHAEDAGPGEVVADSSKWLNLAEFLRRYRDSKVAALMAEHLLSPSRVSLMIEEESARVPSSVLEQAIADARTIDLLLQEVRDRTPGEFFDKGALMSALYNGAFATDRMTWRSRLAAVITLWGGVQPMRPGPLTLTQAVVERWLEMRKG